MDIFISKFPRTVLGTGILILGEVFKFLANFARGPLATVHIRVFNHVPYNCYSKEILMKNLVVNTKS